MPPHPAHDPENQDEPLHAGDVDRSPPTRGRTYFHFAGAEPYEPWAAEPEKTQAPSVSGWLVLPVGARVTFHGREPQTYRVAALHFHAGPTDEAGGLHLFLEDHAAPGSA